MYVYTDINTKSAIAGGMFSKNMHSVRKLPRYPLYGASLALLRLW